MELALASDFGIYELSPESMDCQLKKLADAGFSHVHWCHDWDFEYLYSKWEIIQIKELFEKYKDLLSIMGSSVTHIGDLGAGNTCKLANQIIVACNIAALSEALMLAKKAGTDPEKVFEGIKGGLAGSTVMNAKTPMILAHNYKPGFRIELHIKDLTNALNAGHKVSSPLPLTGQVMEMMQALKADGFEKDDHSALAKYYEKLSNEKIGK